MLNEPAARSLTQPSPRLWRKTGRGQRHVAVGGPARSTAGAMGGLRVAILDSIHQIDAASWDAVTGSSAVFRSHAYLAAAEAAALNDCRYYYVVVFDEDDMIAAHACAYTVTTDFAQLLPAPLRTLCARLRRRWPRLLQVKVTECAAPLVVGHSISLREGCDGDRLVRLIGAAVGDIARREDSPLVVFRDFLEDERPRFAALQDLGFRRVENMPLARVRVRWKSYEEYLAGMRPRYRKDVQRRLRRAARAGQTVRRLTGFAEHAALWTAQSRVVAAKARGFKREVLEPAYYEQMDRALGERSLLLVVERGGRMVAHGMVLVDETNIVATYFGRDAGPPTNEWFQLINEVIRLGIERGSRHINLGLGSYEGKALVGAELEALHVYARSSSPLVNALMRICRRIMTRGVRAGRSVFQD